MFQVSRGPYLTCRRASGHALHPSPGAAACAGARSELQQGADPTPTSPFTVKTEQHRGTHTRRQTDSEELNQHSCCSSAFIALLSSLKRLHSIFNQGPFARLCSTFSRFAPSLLHHPRCTFRALLSSRALLHSDYPSAAFSLFSFSLKLDCDIYLFLVSLNAKSAPP